MKDLLSNVGSGGGAAAPAAGGAAGGAAAAAEEAKEEEKEEGVYSPRRRLRLRGRDDGYGLETYMLTDSPREQRRRSRTTTWASVCSTKRTISFVPLLLLAFQTTSLSTANPNAKQQTSKWNRIGGVEFTSFGVTLVLKNPPGAFLLFVLFHIRKSNKKNQKANMVAVALLSVILL